MMQRQREVLPSRLSGELCLEYHFDSHNDPPFRGIRHISRLYPDLLLKLHSEDSQPAHFFALYKDGERYAASFEEDIEERREELRRVTEESVQRARKRFEERTISPGHPGEEDVLF